MVPRQDGYLDFLNAATGKLISEKYIGTALITEPAVATDANGQMAVVMPASDPATPSGTVIAAGIPSPAPGFMFALSTATPAGTSDGN